MTFFTKFKKLFCLNDDINKPDLVFSPEILREYDIRGIVDENLHFEDAYHIGKAFGTILIRKNLKKICVGYDCRISSHTLSKNLIKGLISTGAEVISLGLCHTPLVYYATHKINVDAGIMVTGSHNPPNHNGFKFTLGMDPFYGNSIKELGNIIIQKDYVDGIGREIIMNNVFHNYIKDITSDFHFSDDIKVVWDIGNGATSYAIKSIISILPGKHHLLFEEMDGRFPNRPPDPTVAANIQYLSKFMSYNAFDIGFAFDSDGDRLGVVNNKGEMLHSDQVLAILAKDFLQKNPGAQVIADVKSCNKLFNTIRENGGIGLMEKVGHSFIKAKMKACGALLAGEMSGHFFFKDRWFGFDDGIYAALRCIEILCTDNNAFNDTEYGFVTPEIRILCEEKEKFIIIDTLKSKMQNANIPFVAIDGIRVTTEIGWWLLRASNTQNAISIRIEAYSQEAIKTLKQQIAKYLVEYIPSISEELARY